jgi:phosphatidylinositol dimannoside acyltransferase
MESVAAQVVRQELAAPVPRSLMGRVRRAAAEAWLRILFWHAQHAPWIVKRVRKCFVFFALFFSRQLQDSTECNARRILGTPLDAKRLRQFSREVVGNFYDFVYDVGRSVRMTRAELLRQIDSIDGAEKYDAARKLNKGLIVVTAHMGSFEVGLAALLEREKHIHVVFKRDAAGLFERLRQKLRDNLGVIEAPIDDGWPMWMRLRDALARNEVVALQGDRVMPGQKGQAGPFFLGHALFPTGPIKLALASGAPLLPIFSERTREGKVKIFIEPAIVVDEHAPIVDGLHPALLELVKQIEKHVSRHPEQWLVLEHAFCEDLERRKAGVAQ